jgi:hypothetical protein
MGTNGAHTLLFEVENESANTNMKPTSKIARPDILLHPWGIDTENVARLIINGYTGRC